MLIDHDCHLVGIFLMGLDQYSSIHGYDKILMKKKSQNLESPSDLHRKRLPTISTVQAVGSLSHRMALPESLPGIEENCSHC